MNECVDHKGVKYSSQRSMCRVYGVPDSIYYYRRAHGWSLKDTLEKRVDIRSNPVPCTDYKGIQYPSISKMCEAYGINVGTYIRRVDRGGWPMKCALLVPARESGKKSNTYNSI